MRKGELLVFFSPSSYTGYEKEQYLGNIKMSLLQLYGIVLHS